ncbi:Ectonucleoside triphosphate diphosphohydrolase 5 [Bagarius yarrelli]|uniref:nucleoside diphosphate phosphatase n=1 Tax=Bagarius yarrelli TaxID=175774 RepID=A0A556TSM6_BAGYA|nr:Ectonucleoside triphosphate diphosphohydrolase 5 [Bagarius yarrelli]
MAPFLHLLFLWLLVRSSESYVGNGLEFGTSIEKILPSVTHRANGSRRFYGIMFDAGSTGTRVHIYRFIQEEPKRLPILDNEAFQSVKPGLAAYADMPEKAGDLVNQLLKFAKSVVPYVEWKQTPVMLKATAGLRMLPLTKAHALLQEVQFVFENSPFYVPADSVSIMNGTSEGILAWVSVNYLTGPTGYKSCYSEMLKVVKGVIQEADDMEDGLIYAFSYYFDHAVEAGLVDEARGGALRVWDFRKRAKEGDQKAAQCGGQLGFGSHIGLL